MKNFKEFSKNMSGESHNQINELFGLNLFNGKPKNIDTFVSNTNKLLGELKSTPDTLTSTLISKSRHIFDLTIEFINQLKNDKKFNKSIMKKSDIYRKYQNIIGRIIPNEYSINRKDYFYLGNIHGLWTLPDYEWLNKDNDIKLIVGQQLKEYIVSNINNLLEFLKKI